MAKEVNISQSRNVFYEETRNTWKEYEEELKKHNRLSKEDIARLQERLVQACIDFINEFDIGDLEEVRFNCDSLQTSARYGKWTSATDSFISGYGNELIDNGKSCMIGPKELHSYG